MGRNEFLLYFLKKIAVILLLGLLLFNWIGYRLLTSYMEQAADTQLQTTLDDNKYDEDQLISVKVPVTHLSYYQNSREFESVAGKIEIGGVIYSYVKRRIFNDSLEMLCIPDVMAMKFRATKNDFFVFASGLQHTGQGEKQTANAGATRIFAADYFPPQHLSMRGAVYFTILKRFTDNSPLSNSAYSFAPEHPPKAARIIA